MNLYTREDVSNKQKWSLDKKISVSQTRLQEWYYRWDNQVYISFSGGKDSTVLADVATRMCKIMELPIRLVFSDTGLEYPEIRKFVKYFASWLEKRYDHKIELVIIKPKMKFDDVIKKYGYPIISKDISNTIAGAKKTTNNTRYQKLCGQYTDKHTGKLSQYNCPQYKYLLDAEFKISDKCCDKLKKDPFKLYEKETGYKMISAMMADESRKRMRDYQKTGCNAFDLKRPQSQPMGYWTEQDVLKYLLQYHIPYCDVYGKIIEENGKLRTTMENRTGCIFCGFGCHMEKEPNRFQRMKQTHPKQYEYCVKPVKDGGMGLGKVLDFIGVNYK